ncbi:MAG: ATP-binding protein [Gallionella sp.]|nr:ATP-binding protein [Gallionella sp.]
MSKINQIQSALKELDGGAFQKLADAFLIKKGYDHLVPLGSVIGVNKVKTGTPDTWAILPNGKYIFAEHTTQQAGLFAKLRGDLNKCFDENKTGIPVTKIHEVIFCHTSTLSLDEYNQLQEQCATHGINLNIFDISSISYDLLEKFPGIARDHLSVDVDTGQIISPDEFIKLYGKNKLATRLDTAFYFREEELQLIETALESGDLVIVLGKAGVGKTRVALECCARFNKLHPEYQTLCIFNRGPDLFEDLRIHCSAPGAFLILVDDANRMSKFEYIVQRLQDQRQDQRIKVIVTVRDYAIEKVRDACRSYGDAQEINIPPLKEEQIKKLVEKEYGIRNSFYLDRIADIAQGNPRIAIMTAEVAKEKNTLDSIEDVSCLYDRYYASIRQDLNELGNPELLKAAAIVAFFRTLDRSNKRLMGAIEDAFGISPDAMWELVNRLHNLEICDLYENEAAKVSDQVLATYLFYLAYFKEPVLDFGTLLTAFFPEQQKRLIDAINPVLSAFNSTAVMDAMLPHVDRIWDELDQAGDDKKLFELVDVFWFLKQTDTLVYVRDQIEAMPQSQIDLTTLDFEVKPVSSPHSILSILGSFQYTDETSFRMALNLVCDYFEKRPDELPKLLDLLIERFCFHYTSYIHGYLIQKIVIDVLWERAQQGVHWSFAKVFLAISKKYLHTNFRSSESKDNRTISFRKFELSASNELKQLRKSIWDGLFLLYREKCFEDDVLKVMQHYCKAWLEISSSEIVAQDAVEIAPFLTRALSPLNFKHVLLVHAYLDNLEHYDLPLDETLRNQFENEDYKLYKLLAFDLSDMWNEALSYKECGARKKNEIERYIANFNLEDFKKLLNQCIEIKASTVAGSNRLNQFQQSMLIVFDNFAERDAKLYCDVMKYYLELQTPLEINQYPLVWKLIHRCGVENTYEILSKATFPNQRSWLFSFFFHLPQDEITPAHLNQLLELYRTCEIQEIPNEWDFLLNYRSIDPSIISVATELVLAKTERNKNNAPLLSFLFEPHSKINEEIAILFAGKSELLKRVYFIETATESNMDYDGKAFNQILDMDADFIDEYIDWMFSGKEWLSWHDDQRDYSFIWKRDDYREVMLRIAERIFEHEKEYSAFSYIQTFFGVRNDGKQAQPLLPQQENFILELIESRHSNEQFMRFVFSLVSSLQEVNRTAFISKFIKLNNCFDTFKKLPLEPSIRHWSGSAVPTYQRHVDYYQTLIPLFDTVHYIKHRQYIEKTIKAIREDIERAKKRDFIDD